MNSYVEPSSVSQRQQITYARSYARNIPSQPLQPYLDARPVMTKYTILPIVDQRKQASVPLIQQPTYNTETVFNPGNDGAPWSGFNVNRESELRNQFFALQACPQAAYIPSSKSSLYQVQWQNNPQDVQQQQPFPGLFQQESFSPVNPNPNPEKIGYALFNNATRQQLKELTPKKK